ncbi:MAG: molybdopterin molybdenumtransferase MoeA [Leptolyngbya sp. LCM1.Bin17]|nr:MAG: molybdopterin molybdenumtransferase MoeA [Leptolyngbya sp. LCM1.Bin17]
MLSVLDAEAKILDLATLPQALAHTESLDLHQASGRVLAETVVSPLDVPHWDNSAMDGYAVRYIDVQAATADQPVTLTVTETIPAGQPPTQAVGPGQAARILTGAMMPVGADTVVMQEVTQRQATQVKILAAPEVGQFVRRQGSFYRAGSPLLFPGIGLNGPEIAVLASAQYAQVRVYRQPRVAILSTGNELVEPGTPLQPGQLVDSNQYALAALVRRAGGLPIPLGIIPDQPQTLRQAIATALSQSDIILSSGGVSVGDYDYVDQILADLGATLHIRAVAVKPGKPLTVATLPPGATGMPPLYFGLPGNPVSALVSFWRFVEPALRKRSGLGQGWSPGFVSAITDQPLKATGRRETYVWGHLRITPQGYRFELAGGSHSSGNLVNLAGTNGLAVVPVGTTLIGAHEPVQVMVVGDLR